MPLQGSLKDMSLANLIQVNCKEMRSAHLALEHRGETGEVYFSDGQVVHATCGEHAGEPALFQMLTWDDGKFTLETDAHAPQTSIHTPWNALLLEGMKRLAMGQANASAAPTHTPGASPANEAASPVRTEVVMKPGMLQQLGAIDGVTGVVIAACDGVVLASSIPDSDGEREAAVAVFVGSAAGQIGQALRLDEFVQGVVLLKNKRVLVIGQTDRYIGLWLRENTSPAIVGNAAAQILK